MCNPSFQFKAKKIKKKSTKVPKSLTGVILMVILFLAIILPLVYSEQIFKQDSVTDLKIQCIINGTFCSNSAYCNVTVSYPNGTLLINNQQMTNQISFYNITLPDTGTLGNYACSATCCDGGLCGTATDCDYSITPTGYSPSISQSITMFIIIGILIFAIVLFFIFGISTRYVPAMIACLSIAVILIVFTIGYILNMANITIGEFSSLTNGFTPLYVIFAALLGVGGIGVILFVIVTVFKNFQKTRFGIGE